MHVLDDRIVKGKKTIVVESTSSQEIVRNHITVSRDLEKYFEQFDFWSRYDAEISASNSVLNATGLGNMARHLEAR